MASWDDIRTSLGEKAKPWVVAAAHEIVEACPYPIYWAWAWPGNGVSGDHPKGLALDLGNRDLGGGTTSTAGPERRAAQNWVKGYCLEHHARLGLTYLIADDEIASDASDPDWTWREYDGTNPHTDHVHLSFEARWTYRPPTPQPTPTPEDDVDYEKAAKRTWFERIPNPAAPAGSVPPHASEYMVGLRNGVSDLQRNMRVVLQGQATILQHVGAAQTDIDAVQGAIADLDAAIEQLDEQIPPQ